MANRSENYIRRNGKDLSPWIRDGHIIKCESKVIDLDQIEKKIKDLSEQFNIVSVYYDKFNSPQLISSLTEYGINCSAFDQNAKKFNAPLKFLESIIYNSKIKFVYNPCLLWNFSNVVLYIDGNANIKIVKNKSNDSVDGVVALGMAIGGFLDSKYNLELSSINSYINLNKS